MKTYTERCIEMEYKLIFGNGATLTDLSMNATTIVSKEDVRELLTDDDAMREVHLIQIDENGNDVDIVYEYAKTSGAYLKDDGWNFTIWGASPDEIAIIKMREENDMIEDAIAELASIVGG